MPNQLSDAYVPIPSARVIFLCNEKMIFLVNAENEAHEKNIHNLMTNRTQFSWREGSKPAPDISFEAAEIEYGDPDGRIRSMRHWTEIDWSNRRQRCHRLIEAAQATNGSDVWVSSDTLAWLVRR